MEKVKPKDTNMISDNCSLFHLCELLFSHWCTTIKWVCVINRDPHSLFIFVFHLNFTLTWMTSLGESNNSNTPQLWGLFPQLTMEGYLNDFRWVYYINDSPNRRNKHLYWVTMKYNIKYTSEYIRGNFNSKCPS